MTSKARVWIALTLLVILLFNYAVVGYPLARKSQMIKDKYAAILIKQVKSGDVLKSSEDEYLLDIFRKEKMAIDRKTIVLNCVSASLFILVASWMIFGMLAHKGK